MAHYMALVVVPEGVPESGIESYVINQMLKHFRGDDDGYASPESPFDWYSIGGRFDGILGGGDVATEQAGLSWLQRLTNRKRLNLQRNLCPTEEFLVRCPPDADIGPIEAVLTPDGEWDSLLEDDPGGTGDWASLELERAADVLSEYKGCLVVAVDCHI